MGERIETFECNVRAAIMALAESLRSAVKPQGLVDVPEEAALLAGEEKRFFALHRVGALIGHVEGVCAQIAVRTLRSRSESLVGMTQLLENALSFVQ